MVHDFDVNDPKNMGRPLYFDVGIYLAAVEGMIRADEIERALWMLDNLPAWYRDNPPPEVRMMKQILYENLYDCFDYASDPDEAGWTKENAELQFGTAYTYPRAEVLRDIIGQMNAKGHKPWLCEFSTSHGLLPLGLQREKFEFNFFGKNLNHQALVKLKGWLNDGVWAEQPRVDQKTIFVFTEALEHAYREEDLLYSYRKLAIDFDHLVLSVPYGCLGGGLPNWKTRRLGHIRGYTADEFFKLAMRFFPSYEFKLYKADSMVLHGM